MRINRSLRSVGIIAGLGAVMVFSLGQAALAAADGPTPPKIADPVGSDIAPHGGYSTTTDYCLQCHQVHSSPRTGDLAGEYALMTQGSVNATCNTCHGIGGTGPTGRIDPGILGQQIGTASTRAVFTEPDVHTQGTPTGPGGAKRSSGWTYSWTFRNFGTYGPGPTGPSSDTAGVGTFSSTAGGLYCGSCHSPHGEFGQVVNTKWVTTNSGSNVQPWADGTQIFWKDPNDATGETWTPKVLYHDSQGWWVCDSISPLTNCQYAQVRDAEGQLVSLYGYKLLSSSPNHQYPIFANGAYEGSGGNPPGGLFSDSPINAGTLSGDLSATATTISVNETYTGTFPSTPFHVQIESEKLLVTARTAGSPATYTVSRPVDGTAAAAHVAGTPVQILAGTAYNSIRSYNVDRYNHDGALWCGSCHTSRVDVSFGGQYHNHPTGCDACHGNDDAGDADFPHSASNAPEMLKAIPDALCLECHTAGSLP